MFFEKDTTGAENYRFFSNIRAPSYYTIVDVVGRMCDSCIKELILRSKPGKLYDRCSHHPEKCRMFALENSAVESPSELGPLYDEIAGDFKLDGIRVPLMLDAAIATPKRFFDGYIMAKGLLTGPGTVIYDREGKIVWFETTPAVVTDDHEAEEALERLLKAVE